MRFSLLLSGAALLGTSLVSALPQAIDTANTTATDAEASILGGPGKGPGGPGGPGRPGGPGGPPTPPSRCPKLAPGPVSGLELALAFPAPKPTDLYAIEAIRQATALYALAIDGRAFDVLDRVFTRDARANYSDPIFVLNGVEEIKTQLAPGLAAFPSTQHHLGTQYIHVCDEDTAVSVTYFQASHYFVPYSGIGNPIGPELVLVDNAQYQDVWARQRDGSWKITNRNLVRMVS
jgi:hypothetical protein